MTADIDVYTSATTTTTSQALPARPDLWLAVSSGGVSDLDAPLPVPDMAPALRRFSIVLGQLDPQADEGDLAGLSDEVASWSADRARATQPLVDD